MLLFVVSEGILTAWIRIFNYYDEQANNTELRLFDSLNTFWVVQGVLCALLFLSMVAKYIFLSITVLGINENVHDDMVYSLVRSHSYYFDITPPGRLSNKFSNDLGILDNTFVFVLQSALEGPILTIVLIINISQINPYFIIAGVVGLVGLVAWLVFMKPIILESKQLDLKMKSPVFNQLSQAVSGLIQISIFERMIGYFHEINRNLNSAYRANMFYWFSTRILGVYVSVIVSLVTTVGISIGIPIITAETTGEYAISVTFFTFCLDVLQWCFRQIINTESTMVSVERCFRMIEVEHEKAIEAEYDQQLFKSQN